MRVRLAAAIFLFVCGASAAMAEGGNPFTLACEEGSYMTGFEGRAGAWIDKVTIHCAKWNAKTLKLGEPVSQSSSQGFAGWSDKGNPTDAHCPRGRLIAGPWTMRYTLDDDTVVLHSILFNCRTPGQQEKFGWSDVYDWFHFGSDFPPRRVGDEPHPGCPDGEVATGIDGRSGLYVDYRLRIICGPAPKAPAIKATKPIGAAEQTGRGCSSVRKGGGLIGSGLPPPPEPPPPSPLVEMAETTNDTDVYRRLINGSFVRADDDPDHFLPKGFAAPVILKEGGWWKLELNNVPFGPGGEGWVAADQLKLK
jgi:hypothetical protein